jgi:hypothetical protein
MARSTGSRRKPFLGKWSSRGIVVPDNKLSTPILAESQPHTMHEDRAILDTVFATNRKAIMELHNLDLCPGTTRTAVGEDHQHRDLSTSRIGIPPIPDVLPTTPGTVSVAPKTTPRRSFSQRGMRLGVHMSILDMGAHSAPDALKTKWIQTSRSHHPGKPVMTGARSPEKAHVRFPLDDTPSKANLSPEKKTPDDPNHDRKPSHGWISTPTAGMLHKMIDHLELSHSTGISKLVTQRQHRSSVSKRPSTEAEAEGLRQRRSSATKQEMAAVAKIREGEEERLKQ